MSLKCGIVGLPNVGKSTFFNAIMKAEMAQSANYAFCTIEPNTGKVPLNDARLLELSKISNSEKLVPNYLEIVDIAGLVKGAAKGEGLGNKFLSHIREVDAIIHLVRCFEDDDIIHVENTVDPLRDIEIINTEMILADIESVEARLEKNTRRLKSGDKDVIMLDGILKKTLEILNTGKAIFHFDSDEKIIFDSLNLMSSKPMLYVANVSESEIINGNKYTQKLESFIGSSALKICAKLEESIIAFDDDQSRAEYLSSFGLKESGLDAITSLTFKMLGLQTFYTIGPKEAHAWTMHIGTTAPKAAGIIHTDFEKGFIRAEIISSNDFISCGGESGAKTAGKARLEGKEYIMQDGDISHFRFNV